ncbi:TetR family transcriptional regulator [Saccharopolyspora erythraea NRRL 2338]|uniref:TetR-family transcriptional regulator n=2 Tax=Saccharopolyspora erythraea TaxID=1836 RepID=A4FCS5_SACEN|nr:TetR/AcrR family transcriptional regulator [Saccharopolyspora erythraea]EQD84111.1 TetR family transcriptional regulator [Saccharopolyspora erythraea D]PFG95605.1 TetR family transcriptional regulator [Saccharopolyspora erythraea NRRL 2338]QRK92217.1 TetR/AcrR family transcriptional regulator [Saccharopolyspora erythraea]CAM01850.1 TetR-family transcriptional regulator [Saccharopolyspora erythraea NRRL 2338]
MSGRKQFDVDKALDKAMAVFWQHGYADASLDMLGAATGLGRGSLYGAFGGKDALFRRALDHYSTTYGARYEDALTAHPGDPVRAIEAFFEVILARIDDPAVPKGCLIAQSAAQAAVLTSNSATHVRGLLDLQHARIRAALDDPHVDPAMLDDLATYIVAINQSLAVLSRAGASDAELRAVVRLACETVANRLTPAH